MKITVDKEKCIGCGTCQLTCPQCFEVKNNVAEVIKEDCSDCDPKEAAENCPVGAIKVQ